MFTTDMTVQAIRNWTNLGVELPEGLRSALDTLDALGQADGIDMYYPHADALTPENVGEHIRTLATAKAAKDAEQEVRNQLRSRLARRVIQEGNAAVPEIADQLRPEFDKAAESYAEAVVKLPPSLDAESLVKAGSEALRAFEQAKEAAAVLSMVDGWLATVGAHLPSYAHKVDGNAAVVTRLVSPRDRGELRRLMDARHVSDQAAKEIGPVWQVAAAEGMPFELNLPTDAAEVIQSIQDAEVAAEYERKQQASAAQQERIKSFQKSMKAAARSKR